MGVPYSFERTATAAELHAKYDETLEPGQESDDEVSVAGRVMLVRAQGKIAFARLDDSSGSIQLFARTGVTDDLAEFASLSLADWIGARGRVLKTRKGELSVGVQSWVLLAEARRSFGNKWTGLTDTETRFRQREVDLWVNAQSRATLLLRSRVVSSVRRILEGRGFVEVETPILQPMAGGAAARPFVTHHNALSTDLFLRIAPELYLKRLVVGGFEKVFEIARVFRNEGISPRHNPEFTMLELYEAYADWNDIMKLVEELVSELAIEVRGTSKISYQGRELDLTPPWRRATMAELVSEAIGRNLDVHTPADELRAELRKTGAPSEDPSWGSGKLLLELYEKTVETDLWGPLFVTEFPAEVSPLSRRHRDDSELVERFEAIVAGRELGNAFSELTDPDDQRGRFEAQASARASGDPEAMEVDENYLRALERGLPPTGGLGIGIDRLVMILADASNIREVIAFPTLRPEVFSGRAPDDADAEELVGAETAEEG
ncbi:MAG: lysine--tRNA ligase [Acidimicrobiales bacterium]